MRTRARAAQRRFHATLSLSILSEYHEQMKDVLSANYLASVRNH